MRGRGLMGLLLGILLLSPFARALAYDAPVTVETKWVSKTFAISTSAFSATTLDIGGFGAAGHAVLGNNYTQNGVDGTTLGASVAVTTNTVDVIGLSWKAYIVSGATTTARLQITQTTKTPVPSGHFQGGVFYSTNTTNGNSPFPGAYTTTAPTISTSSYITIPSGVLWQDTFQAQTQNPIFHFDNLNTSATLYFTVDYAVPRPQ